MEKTNCDYYTHDFKKKGGWIQTWNLSPYDNNPENHRYIQEMECTKCKITTYYPSQAFDKNGELK